VSVLLRALHTRGTPTRVDLFFQDHHEIATPMSHALIGAAFALAAGLCGAYWRRTSRSQEVCAAAGMCVCAFATIIINHVCAGRAERPEIDEGPAPAVTARREAQCAGHHGECVYAYMCVFETLAFGCNMVHALTSAVCGRVAVCSMPVPAAHTPCISLQKQFLVRHAIVMQRVEEMGQASEVRAAVSGSWSRAAHTGLACVCRRSRCCGTWRQRRSRLALRLTRRCAWRGTADIVGAL
jgi:hypothetical protein